MKTIGYIPVEEPKPVKVTAPAPTEVAVKPAKKKTTAKKTKK